VLVVPALHRVYATATGTSLQVISSHYLADNAHVVAVDPATGRSYHPVPTALGGRPALLICQVA
jgi:hypothetical protein